MNYSIIRYIIGWILRFEGIFLLLPFLVSLIYREECFYAFPVVSVGCYAVGYLFSFRKPKDTSLYTL